MKSLLALGLFLLLVGSGTAETNSPSAVQSGTVAAQRAALLEDDPDDPRGKRYEGSVLWQTEIRKPTGEPDAPPDLVVRADIEIPERRITITIFIQRDLSPTRQPTSHLIDITFNLPADFPSGGIRKVWGVVMKSAEQTRGSPLGGAAEKVTTNYFLIGLARRDMRRNLQLLKERNWFDIPISYNNGRNAILTIQKGEPGKRAFEKAFNSWKQ
ncbi:MAG: hypothetical protein QOH67_4290 [Hyphomicrobiales bacterium]|jgi:hypothetical protein|nr:hypothetical protein [Hyphomicrobiales bacterium]